LCKKQVGSGTGSGFVMKIPDPDPTRLGSTTLHKKLRKKVYLELHVGSGFATIGFLDSAKK